MISFPEFQPAPFLRGGHRQTVASWFAPGQLPRYSARRHEVEVDGGDEIVLHDDRPEGWQDGGTTALMLHGLTGCHGSYYLRRIAAKLNARGVRTFRMDLRGCGAGFKLAKLPYHGGRSEDAAAALGAMQKLCPGSPTALIGFSLGANIVLKLLGEDPDRVPGSVTCAATVSPSIDLRGCVLNLQRPSNRWYDRYFVKRLWQQIHRHKELIPDAAMVEFPRQPATLYEFDDWFTAPVCGFGNADNYYAACSSAQFLNNIQVPTLILAARDDPLVPFTPFKTAQLSSAVHLVATGHGGHMGFVGRLDFDTDRRWMDWRVVDWVGALAMG